MDGTGLWLIDAEDHAITTTWTPLALGADGVEFRGVDEEADVFEAKDVCGIGGHVEEGIGHGVAEEYIIGCVEDGTYIGCM